MSYIPPDLSLNIVLPQQTGDLAALDVVLCAPISNDALLTLESLVTVSSGLSLSALRPDAVLLSLDSTVVIDSDVSLDVKTGAPQGYEPPPLSADVVLAEDLFGPSSQIRDVVLCRPQSEIDKDTFIGLNGIIAVSSDIELGADIPEPRHLTIDSTVTVTPELSLDVTEYVVGVSIDTHAGITISSEIEGYYYPKVYRGAIHDVSSDLQYSKMQGIDKSGGFEGSAQLKSNTDAHCQQSQLIGDDNRVQAEANRKLYSSNQSKADSSNLVGQKSTQKGEYQRFVAKKNKSKSEASSLVGDSTWYGFEAMLKRQTERKSQGEYSYLDAIKRAAGFEYSRFAVDTKALLSETARLPFSKLRYVPPPLWQTIILPEQLAPPSMPLDVVLCAPRGQRMRTKVSISGDADINAIGYLSLTADEYDPDRYNTGVIFVTNSVSLTRSDDGREIKMFDFTVGIDNKSYCWSFSANVPLSELSKVNTAYEQLIGVDFECNGHLWRFILDSCDDSISFGSSSLTIKGKSRAMLLATPYSEQRGYKYISQLTARQIAEDELNRGGIASGFTLDWQLVSTNGWDVPADTYSYTGRTPINSLQWIAEAAGGFVNAHMSDDVISMLHDYPLPSWEWSSQSPSLMLPQSLITSRTRNRVTKPAYNGVLVYGEHSTSFGGLIKRIGTSGSYQPPMVTGDLITDQAVAIARGKAILSDTGDIGNIGVSMPLHQDFGVIKPSTLIGVNDGESWIGMVRGTTISGKLSSNQALQIEQSINVERHFDKEGA